LPQNQLQYFFKVFLQVHIKVDHPSLPNGPAYHDIAVQQFFLPLITRSHISQNLKSLGMGMNLGESSVVDKD
jgi:hypothetical protein